MNEMTVILVIVLLFALRFVLPLVFTVGAGYVENRWLNRHS
ncbi:MAG: hypothetical protein BroJett015_03860 [Chloroflexota bacterium]|nr:MAG: hypothetical protein BroJett015_03860 [Chloroflexota bacterium]